MKTPLPMENPISDEERKRFEKWITLALVDFIRIQEQFEKLEGFNRAEYRVAINAALAHSVCAGALLARPDLDEDAFLRDVWSLLLSSDLLGKRAS